MIYTMKHWNKYNLWIVVYIIPSSVSTLKLAQQPSNTNLYIYLNNEWNNKYCHFINKRASLVYHLTVAGTWVMFYTTLRKHCDEYDKTQLIINILRQRLSRIHYFIQNNNIYWPRLAILNTFKQKEDVNFLFRVIFSFT